MRINPGILYLGAAFILAASSVVAAAYVTGTLAPFALTFWSLFFALIGALLISWKSMLATARELGRAEWIALFWQAFFGIALFRICLTVGLVRTSAAEAGILIGCTPAITAVLTRLFLGEALSLRAVAGIAATLAGILVLQGFPFSMNAFTTEHLVGNLLIIGAAFCESMFTVLARKLQTGRRISAPINPIAQTGLVSAVSIVLCFIPALLEGELAAVFHIGWGAWAALAWYGVMVTIVAFALMFMGARYCDGYTIAGMSGVIPLAAVLLSIVFLGESVSSQQWAGCACIIAAIVIMARRPSSASPGRG